MRTVLNGVAGLQGVLESLRKDQAAWQKVMTDLDRRVPNTTAALQAVAAEQAAVRKANWKLIRSRDGDQLYDLAADMGEGHDLAADQPQKVAELVRDYEQWDKQLAAPLWKGVDRGAGLLPPDRPAVRNRAKPPGQ